MKKFLALLIFAAATSASAQNPVPITSWSNSIVRWDGGDPITAIDCTTNLGSVATCTNVGGVLTITFQEFAGHAYFGNATGGSALPAPSNIAPDDLGAATDVSFVLTRTGASTMNWATPAAGGLSDIDYGDVTVSSGGTVMTVENTRTHVETLKPETAQFLATAFPQYLVNLGTNFPVSGLAYDAATDEAAFWKFIATRYSTGNLTITLYWYADTDTTAAHSVAWEAQITALTTDTDTTNVETDSLATLNFVVDTLGSTDAQRVQKSQIVISNLDSLADGDLVFVRIARDANGTNGTDDVTGDAILIYATVSYAETF